MIIYDTPSVFKPLTNHTYPPNNNQIFEHYFMERAMNDSIELDRIYLPIQWTCFYIERNYGKNDMSDLQAFLNSLPRDKKYFTVIQYDDGILQNIDGLDIKIYASGGVGTYPIPLLCQPYQRVERQRDIFASFVGTFTPQYIVRNKMREVLGNLSGYTISDYKDFNYFKETMERSIFALCPRGYGKTSFRICEALNLGAIPVYIYDDKWIPYEHESVFNAYGVLCHIDEINKLDEVLKRHSEGFINLKQEVGQLIYGSMYSYETCYNQIIYTEKK